MVRSCFFRRLLSAAAALPWIDWRILQSTEYYLRYKVTQGGALNKLHEAGLPGEALAVARESIVSWVSGEGTLFLCAF